MDVKFCLLATILILLIYGCTESSDINENNTQIIKNPKPHNTSDPLDTLENYLSHFNYTGISERIDTYKSKEKYVCGELLEFLRIEKEIDEEYLKYFHDMMSLYQETDNLLGTNNYANMSSYIEVFNSTSFRKEIVSQQITDNYSDEYRILVEAKNFIILLSYENITFVKTTYILTKNQDVWKICDYIDDEGVLFSDQYNITHERELLAKLKQDHKETLQTIRKIFEKYNSELTKYNNLQHAIRNAAVSIVNKQSLIDVNLSSDTQTGYGYVISISYRFKDQLFVDGFLQVMYDMSELYKAFFQINNNITLVQIGVIESVKDDYGNTQSKLLARSNMKKDTYNKINWEGFEPNRLSKITPVAYYDSSFYKDLSDLQESLENYQTQNVGMYDHGLCSDANLRCQVNKDCHDIEELKEIGFC